MISSEERPMSSITRKFIIFLLFFALAGFVAPVCAKDGFGADVTISRLAVGQVGLLSIDGASDCSVMGAFLNQPLRFYRRGEHLQALLPVDLSCSPGVYFLVLHYERIKDRVIEEREIQLQIYPTEFRVESLNLPSKMVKFSDSIAKRIEKEKELVQMATEMQDPERLWAGNFIRPLGGEVSGFFGSRRILNGEGRSPHLGVDIRAKLGEPVLCSNKGRVVLIGDFYLTGETVLVDHGQGLYTIYCHLSKISVHEGDLLIRGQVLGEAGSTGRSTGPHLHWGIYICGARVDPLSLLQITAALKDGGAY